VSFSCSAELLAQFSAFCAPRPHPIELVAHGGERFPRLRGSGRPVTRHRLNDADPHWSGNDRLACRPFWMMRPRPEPSVQGFGTLGTLDAVSSIGCLASNAGSGIATGALTSSLFSLVSW
jgi:hypothetical protein